MKPPLKKILFDWFSSLRKLNRTARSVRPDANTRVPLLVAIASSCAQPAMGRYPAVRGPLFRAIALHRANELEQRGQVRAGPFLKAMPRRLRKARLYRSLASRTATTKPALIVSYRVAVPADIYISVELPENTSDRQVFASAAARLEAVCEGEPFIGLQRDFDDREGVLVYLGRDLNGMVRVADCTLEDVEEPEGGE